MIGNLLKLSFFLLLSTAVIDTAWSKEKIIVLELFTAQGCIACPPADAIVEKLADRHDILPLSFHVDYKDHLGWKDKNALPENTKRQRFYAEKFDMGYISTPQIVIQGHYQTHGADLSQIEYQLRKSSMLKTVPVNIQKMKNGSFDIAFGDNESAEEGKIFFVGFDHQDTVRVLRGDNRGKKITYRNVVRSYQEEGPWNKSIKKITLPASKINPHHFDSFAILLQSIKTGKILGAGYFTL